MAVVLPSIVFYFTYIYKNIKTYSIRQVPYDFFNVSYLPIYLLQTRSGVMPYTHATSLARRYLNANSNDGSDGLISGVSDTMRYYFTVLFGDVLVF